MVCVGVCQRIHLQAQCVVHVLLDHSGISGAVLGMVQILILGIGLKVPSPSRGVALV